MSMSPNEKSGEPGIFLMRRHAWFHRAAMGLPKKPTTGDRGPVRDALLDVIDAAGGLEFSRGEFVRVIGIAQEEYTSLFPGVDRLVGCCRFQRHRVRCMHETGGAAWSDASLRESSKWRR